MSQRPLLAPQHKLMGALPFLFLKYETNVSEYLRFIKEQANRLLPVFTGQPARPTPGCQGRLDGVSRLLGGDLDLRQTLQVQPGMIGKYGLLRASIDNLLAHHVFSNLLH